MCTRVCVCVCVHMRVCSHFSHIWLFVTLWTVPARSLCPWESLGKNTGVGYHAPLKGIFLAQGLNLPLSPALEGEFFYH